jgi:predicted DsbA family dithiol-disulfide isomerase
MTPIVEVFADVGCPFAHVGLSLVASRLAEMEPPVDCHVRAWPLEWVNGSPLEGDAVAVKIAALRDQLDVDCFNGFDADQFPTTTIPALNLCAEAYGRDAKTGLEVSLAVRNALFEEGLDVGRMEVLAKIAAKYELPAPSGEPSQVVLDEYAEGRARGVRGSPDFYLGEAEFFCPSLDLSHDEDGRLLAKLDIEEFEEFLEHVESAQG